MNITNVDQLKSCLADIVLTRSSNKEIIKWFDSVFVKWYLSSDDDDIKNVIPHTYIPGSPEWMNKPGVVDFHSFPTGKSEDGFMQNEKLTVNDINQIIEYLNSLDTRSMSKIYKQPARVIFTKTETFIKTAPVHGLKEGLDYKVIRNVNNWKWVELLSKAAYKNEGDVMGHCAGSYTIKDSISLISLWDHKDQSHVTIEIWDNEVTQIKGKKNKAPGEKYVKAVSDFAEYLLSTGIPIVDDGQNIGWLSYNPNKVLNKVRVVPDPITGKEISGRRYVNPHTDNGRRVFNDVIEPHRFARLGVIAENCVNDGQDFIFINNGVDTFDLSDLYISTINQMYETMNENKQEVLNSIIDRVGRSNVNKLNKIIRLLNNFTNVSFAEGMVDVSGNMLQDLKGLPGAQYISARNNILKSLEGVTNHCQLLDIRNNKLSSLESLPEKFTGKLHANDNLITTLSTSRGSLNDMMDLNVAHNKLIDLHGAPTVIGTDFFAGNFIANNNFLKTLDGGPEIVYGDYNVSGNPLIDISNLPRKVNGNLTITKTSICDDINHKYISDNCIVKGNINIL